MREALSRVIPEIFVEQVLKIALSGAGLDNTPEEETDRIEFLDGALYAAMEAQFGSIPAALGIQEVKRILGLPVTVPPAFMDAEDTQDESGEPDGDELEAESDEDAEELDAMPEIELPDIEIDEMVDALGATDEPKRHQTAPVANPNAVFEKITRPVLRPAWKNVLVASKEKETSKKLEKAMKGAPVKHLDKPKKVAKELAEMEEANAAVLVIDCRPEKGFTDLIEFAVEPQPGLVIVWGDPDRLPGAQIVKMRPNWIQCHADVHPEDLGLMIRAFPRDFIPPTAVPPP